MRSDIDERIYDLYDRYCHSGMGRREFLRRAASLGVVGGVSMALALVPDYANACQVNFNDERIVAEYARFPSPGGNGAELRGYLAHPKGDGAKYPAVVVIHENRGLNPYIEDVARRLAVAGYLALAPDALWAVGGYPGNDDEGKALQSKLVPAKILADMVNAAKFVGGHALSNGRLGAVGFCFGGMVCNHLAVTLGKDLRSAAPFYGRPADPVGADKIQARLLLHYAENDEGVNATRQDYEAALKKQQVRFESHVYPGTQHGFHNDSTPRYDAAAAELAWKRTLELFAATLV
jgi:carboxymethylenebutenolidase